MDTRVDPPRITWDHPLGRPDGLPPRYDPSTASSPGFADANTSYPRSDSENSRDRGMLSAGAGAVGGFALAKSTFRGSFFEKDETDAMFSLVMDHKKQNHNQGG